MGNVFNVEMGIRIRYKRELLGYTREELAEKLELSPKHISDIERGVNGISTAVLIGLCNILHTTADYILFGREKYTDNTPVIDAVKTIDEKHMKSAEELLKVFIKALND